MDISPLILLWLFIIFWSIYNLIRSLLTIEYQRKLYKNYGLSLGLISIIIENQSITKWINNLKINQQKFYYLKIIYNYYFRLSVIISYLLFPYALYQISKSLFYANEIQHLFNHFLSFKSATKTNYNGNNNNNNNNNQFMVMFPGLTLSLNDSIYFFLSICICSLLHELGHSFAANRHSIKIDTFGFQFNFCLPLTFVSIPMEQYLKNNNILAKMEITCAGFMSNFLICLIALFCIIINPMSIFFTSINNGLLITSVDQSIITGLNEYDIITKINNVPINNQNDLLITLNEISKYQTGFCIGNDFIDQFKQSSSSSSSSMCNFENCCNGFDQQKNLCFIYKKQQIIIMKDKISTKYIKNCNIDQHQLSLSNVYHLNETDWQNYYKLCLPVRKIIEKTTQFCRQNIDCLNTYYGQSQCIYPIAIESKSIRLLIIETDEHKMDKILYWGPPIELIHAIKVTKMKPLFSFITIDFYYNVETFFRFLFIISITMIQFNILPFSPLDGYQMLTLATDYIETKFKFKSKFRLLHRLLHLWSAIIIFMYIFLSIFKIFNHHY